MIRTGREVAGQAIIYGTLGFRASLEVTDHTRSVDLCSRLLPWLEELGLGPQIELFRREILTTAHGKLPQDSMREAYWRGEGDFRLGLVSSVVSGPRSCEFCRS